jgi:hypothetical protein
MQPLKVYGDTCTLIDNPSDPVESEALKKLVGDPRVRLFTSNIVSTEATNTRDEVKRNVLVTDHEAREKVPQDEKLLGFNSYGDSRTWICSPMISDIQDEALHAEIMNEGIKLMDGKHLTQAASNKCDIFLTCDNPVIRRRQWLEQRLSLRVMRPSELLNELESGKHG